MSGPSVHAAVSASPESSDAVDSQTVTPATKLSSFTPEGTRASSSSSGRGIVRAKVPPPFDLNNTSSHAGKKAINDNSAGSGFSDPFISASSFASNTTNSSVDPSKLSPAAAAFTPATALDSPAFSDQQSQKYSGAFGKAGNNNTVLAEKKSASNLLGVKYGYGDRVPSLLGHSNSTPNNFFPKIAKSSPGAAFIPRISGTFSSEDETSRCLMVRFPNDTPRIMLEQHYSKEFYPSLIGLFTEDLLTRGIVYVRFADIRDADKAYSDALPGHARHMNPSDLYSSQHFSGPVYQTAAAHEGQLIVRLTYLGHAQHFNDESLKRAALQILEKAGEIMAIKVVVLEIPRLTLQVEFFSIKAVDELVRCKSGVKIPLCNVDIETYGPDNDKANQVAPQLPGPVIIGEENPSITSVFEQMTLNDNSNPNRPFPGPSRPSMYKPSVFAGSFTHRKENIGQHTPSPLRAPSQGVNVSASLYSPSWNSPFNAYGLPSPLWSPYSPGTIGQERQSPSASQDPRELYHQQSKTLSRSSSRQMMEFPTANHNVVDAERIRAGLDVRTTIMLRNIPNKIDQSMLKDIIDETSLGKYDFMYLRIDFANNCNVGYAFINFADPIYIVDFVNARAGHRWNRYNSDKVAEVSYATIQGRDCLIQKFRNSSVMLEHPSFRPKLFRTGTGSLVGTEEKFPGPDNPSKMRRSVENAEHVGLFAPRAGQNFRDEQRRRRSQYDRGTRMSEAEDIYEPSEYAFSQMCRPLRPIPSLESGIQAYTPPYF